MQRRKAHCSSSDKTDDRHRGQRDPRSHAGEIQNRGSGREEAEAKRRRKRPAHFKMFRRQKQGEWKTNGSARQRDKPNYQDIVHAPSRPRVASSCGSPDALSIQLRLPRQVARGREATHLTWREISGASCLEGCRRLNQGAGAARGIRTPDPVITNDVLYQLSYCGEPCRGPGDADPDTRAPDIGHGPNWQGQGGSEMRLTRPSATRIRASHRPGPWACRFVPQIHRSDPRRRCRDRPGHGRSG